MLCSADATLCTQWDIPFAPGVRESAWKYSKVMLEARDPLAATALDLWHGHQFCFFVTLGQSLPWFFVMIAALYIIIGLAKLPFVVLSAGVQFMAQAVAFTHAE